MSISVKNVFDRLHWKDINRDNVPDGDVLYYRNLCELCVQLSTASDIFMGFREKFIKIENTRTFCLQWIFQIIPEYGKHVFNQGTVSTLCDTISWESLNQSITDKIMCNVMRHIIVRSNKCFYGEEKMLGFNKAVESPLCKHLLEKGLINSITVDGREILDTYIVKDDNGENRIGYRVNPRLQIRTGGKGETSRGGEMIELIVTDLSKIREGEVDQLQQDMDKIKISDAKMLTLLSQIRLLTAVMI